MIMADVFRGKTRWCNPKVLAGYLFHGVVCGLGFVAIVQGHECMKA